LISKLVTKMSNNFLSLNMIINEIFFFEYILPSLTKIFFQAISNIM